jgi:glycolate oxidase FAD binding subunit
VGVTTVVSDAALSEFAAEIGDEGPVGVEGARTRWSVGGLPSPGTRFVKAPSGIVEYRPEEMTVRVRAGTPVDELDAALSSRRQRCALPRRHGTVGGAVAVGQNDVAVLGRGRVRDCLLQVTYVSDTGRLVRGGGPTVKNVSGFDLPRLMVGSLGTLGSFAEVLLRTNPLPRRSVLLVSPDADPFAAAETLTRPSAVLWDGSQTFVEIEGHPDDVDAERFRLGTVGSWDEASDWPELPPQRWSLAPGDLRKLDPSNLGRFVASIGVGTLYADQPQPSAPVPSELARLHARVKEQFDPMGRLNPGRVVLGGSS